MQWDKSYPTINHIKNDLQNNSLYGIFLNDILYGVYVLDNVQSPEYTSVNWIYNEAPIAVLHRMAVDPDSQSIGIGERLLVDAIHRAKNEGYKTIRLDAFSENEKLLRFYEKRGFQFVGEIPLEYTVGPFSCFEMSLI